MTKLTTSYAILALEACGYEEASNKKLSFSKVISAVTVICRINDSQRHTVGDFVAQLTLEGQTFQSKLSTLVMVESDIVTTERALIAGLLDTVTISHDLAKADWEALDRRYRRANALIQIATDLTKK